mmetsp:Transcript_10018/g.26423  ORF Transcript_10018/g.26423 Transcript_10018/m.26423 type:complete len:105 (-) Transcript_10018:21-335(-)
MQRRLSSGGVHSDAELGIVETVPWLAPGSAAVTLHYNVDAKACAMILPPLLTAPTVYHGQRDMPRVRNKKSALAIIHKWAQCNETRHTVERIMGSVVRIPKGFA